MTNLFQITANEIISGVCSAINKSYEGKMAIYKEDRNSIETPGITVYCINYSKVTERFDRFTNTFSIIINYFPKDSVKINNKRMDMSMQAEKIMEAIRYIPLPASRRTSNTDFQDITLPCRASGVSAEEKDGFMQIVATYTVRTKHIPDDNHKMGKIQCKTTIK